MQNPVGFEINEVTGRAELTSFAALLKNHQLWLELPHVIFGAFVTGAFVVVGLSAWKILRKEDIMFFKKSMKVGLVIGLISSILTIGWGHAQTQAVIEDHPMKFAAMEGIYEDVPQPAPWKLVGLMDNKNKTEGPSIEIPYLLSMLGSSHEGDFKGINTVNEEMKKKYGDNYGEEYREMDYYVPVNTLFWSFRVMAGFGTLLALLAAIGLFVLKNDKILKMKWLQVVLAICTFVPFIANSAGWLITEMGRFPWTVYGIFTIADSVSPSVTANQLLFTNIFYFMIFTLLGGVLVFLVHRTTKYGPYVELKDETTNVDPLAKEAF